MRRGTRIGTFALLLLVGLLGATGVVVAAPGVQGAEANKELAEARRATAQYHRVENALADGFINTGFCVEVPGLGAMGIHFINIERIMDPGLDPSEPEGLLYIPTKSGKLRLVAVEYVQAIGAPDAPVPDPAPPAPSLFGRTFDGPMVGHGPGEPPHYDLHVWLWRSNPEGIFAQFNPKLSCGD